MRRWWAIGFLPLIGAMGAQDGADKEIVVVGPSPSDIVVVGAWSAVRTGEWLFERTATFPVGGPPAGFRSRPMTRILRSFKYRMCIGEGDMRDAIGMMLGADPMMERGGTCAQPRLRIANGRIEGGYRCSSLAGELVRRVSGTVMVDVIDVKIASTYQRRSGSTSQSRSKLTARYLGECPPKPSATTPPTPTEG